MKVKFTVGEMAKLHNLQKQTLIFYDKEDVFKPQKVDASNGYRYYTDDQLEILDSILMLRDAGMPLKQIKEFIKERDVSSAENMLKAQMHDVLLKAQKLNQIALRLQRKIETLENIKNLAAIKIIKTKKSEYFATEPVKKPCNLLQVDIATKQLLAIAKEKELPFYYQLGVIVPIENVLSGYYEAASHACLPLLKKVNGKQIFEKKPSEYARCYHIGSYDTIGTAYKKLLNYISSQGYSAQYFSIEYCVSDSLTTKFPEEYITEIQIPVVKANESIKE